MYRSSALFAAGLLVIAVATAAALHEVYARLPSGGSTGRWRTGLALAGVAAAAVAVGGLAVRTRHAETGLLAAGALFVVTATAVSAAWDRRAITADARPGGA